MVTSTDKISVFCVDDNAHVLHALKLRLEHVEDMKWAGCAEHADGLIEHAERKCPHVVLLDLDMPGKDPFVAIDELCELCPQARVVVYSGMLRRELVDRAIEAGAWGYVAKTDGESDLFTAIRAAANGAMSFSTSIRSMMGSS